MKRKLTNLAGCLLFVVALSAAHDENPTIVVALALVVVCALLYAGARATHENETDV